MTRADHCSSLQWKEQTTSPGRGAIRPNSPSSSPPLPPSPLPSISTLPLPQSQLSNAGMSPHGPSEPASPPAVPLGRTRCYWALLSPSLDFMFLDPVLDMHLEGEKEGFLNSSLLDWVHPDEVESMRGDLVRGNHGGGVEEGGVFGSVTTCRYSRVPRIRRLLGAISPPQDPDADLFTIDSEYLPLRITTSWIGAPSNGGTIGAVLAFFHATEDKSTVLDNDESLRSSWTNWCGPTPSSLPYLSQKQCSDLSRCLAHLSSTSSRHFDRSLPSHVFQILDIEGSVLVSFPEEGYDPENYAGMAREVVKRPKGVEEATTSCTRRYRSKHPVMKNGLLMTIESVVIRYGQVTFAIYTTASIYSTQHQRSISAPNLPTMALETVPIADHQLVTPSPLRLPLPLPLPPPLPLPLLAPIDPTFNKRQRQTRYNPSVPVSPYQSFNSDSDRPLSISTARRFSSHALFVDGHGGEVSPTVVRGAAILGSLQRSMGYEYTIPPQPQLTNHDPTRGMDYYNAIHTSTSYPPTMHPLSESYPREHHHLDRSYSGPSLVIPSLSLMHSSDTSSHPQPLSTLDWTSTPHDTGTSLLVAPPLSRTGPKPKAETHMKRGQKPCTSCGTKESPEWRKGPGGPKTLCNGCGLRHARLLRKAKKEGENGGKTVLEQVAIVPNGQWTAISSYHSSSSHESEGSPIPATTSSSLPRSTTSPNLQRLTASLPILPPRRSGPSPQLVPPSSSSTLSRSTSPPQPIPQAFPFSTSPSLPLTTNRSPSPHVYYDYTFPSQSPRPPTSVYQSYNVVADPRPVWNPASPPQSHAGVEKLNYAFGEREIVYGHYGGFAEMEEE